MQAPKMIHQMSVCVIDLGGHLDFERSISSHIVVVFLVRFSFINLKSSVSILWYDFLW